MSPTVPVHIQELTSPDPDFGRVGTPAVHTDERYLLDITPNDAGSPATITVTSGHEAGRRWGLAHAERLATAGTLAPGHHDEYPRFQVRGVVEGFYGTPWTHAQRRDMIRFLAQHRMNTFVYSPKDDHYTRRKWREPYPAAELAQLVETVQVATDGGVAVAYGISPGLSIRYSDPAELELLLAKLAQVGALGIHSFQLLLDDIPTTLPHHLDRDAYPDLVSAQVDLIDRLRRRLDEQDPRIGLQVCPTTYHGRGDETYLRRLGLGTDPRIDLLWTGRAICSPVLDLADAATFARTTARPVLYWDNYPVNDVAMTAELHLGAYRGRDPHLFRFARGVIANPMERPESSKVALATVADYLWDPVGYDPDRSWRAAALAVAGSPADADALLLFADNVRTSCLEESDAHLLTSALERLEFEEELGDPQAGRAALRALAERFRAAADLLLGAEFANQTLAAEIRPWVHRFRQGADDLIAMLDGRSALPAGYGRAASPAVYGDVLDMFVRSRHHLEQP